MRSFKKFITEGGGPGVGTTDQNLAVDFGINPSAVQEPEIVKKLNSFIGAVANAEFILPEHGIDKIRRSLSRVGFSFGATPTMEGQSGSFELPLTRFGGRFGKDTDTPADEVINDDGNWFVCYFYQVYSIYSTLKTSCIR